MSAEKDDNLYSLFFFTFILLTYFLSFLKARAKKQKEKQVEVKRPAQPKPPPLKQAPPKPPRIQVQKVEESKPETKEEVSLDSKPYRKKAKPARIKALVEELPDKRNLVLLAEILKPYDPLH